MLSRWDSSKTKAVRFHRQYLVVTEFCPCPSFLLPFIFKTGHRTTWASSTGRCIKVNKPKTNNSYSEWFQLCAQERKAARPCQCESGYNLPVQNLGLCCGWEWTLHSGLKHIINLSAVTPHSELWEEGSLRMQWNLKHRNEKTQCNYSCPKTDFHEGELNVC